MANNSDNVRVGEGGAVYSAPLGTAVPTSAIGALNVAFKDHGYVSEEGVTETRDRTTTKIKGWQGAATVREVVTDAEYKLAFTLLETKKENIELYYGNTVNTTNGSIDIDPAETGGRRIFVVDVVDGLETQRVLVRSGEITEVGDQVFRNGEPIGYQVTVIGYPVNGVSATKFYSGQVVTP